MDSMTPEQRGEQMGRIKSRNTGPEMRVRRLIHSLGFRYRLHEGALPGHPDIVFRKRKLAIFVHGCFWHRHQDPTCRLARLPKSRLDFWLPKLEGNRARDQVKTKCLEDAGWRVRVIWECQTKASDILRNAVSDALREP